MKLVNDSDFKERMEEIFDSVNLNKEMFHIGLFSSLTIRGLLSLHENKFFSKNKSRKHMNYPIASGVALQIPVTSQKLFYPHFPFSLGFYP